MNNVKGFFLMKFDCYLFDQNIVSTNFLEMIEERFWMKLQIAILKNPSTILLYKIAGSSSFLTKLHLVKVNVLSPAFFEIVFKKSYLTLKDLYIESYKTLVDWLPSLLDSYSVQLQGFLFFNLLFLNILHFYS